MRLTGSGSPRGESRPVVTHITTARCPDEVVFQPLASASLGPRRLCARRLEGKPPPFSQPWAAPPTAEETTPWVARLCGAEKAKTPLLTQRASRINVRAEASTSRVP